MNLFTIDSKILLMMGRRLIGRDLEESQRSPEFLKTGHTEECFQLNGKHDCLIHLLKSLDKIGVSSGLGALRTTTGI